MVAPLAVPERDFSLLASGGGDLSTVERLLAGQYSRRALLMVAVLELAHQRVPGIARSLNDSYRLLCRLQRTAPDAVREVITLPHTGNWAAACLRDDASEATYRYLACLAATAAFRAGQEFELGVPVVDGAVCLPTLGSVKLSHNGERTAVVRSRAGQLTISVPGQPPATDTGTPAPGWRPAQFLCARAHGHDLGLYLDDYGPFRAPPGLVPAPALTAGKTADWQETLEASWRILVRRHHTHAQALAAGLQMLVPLRARDDRSSDSATATDAIGAVMLTLPPDAESLALTLLHEFQHTKLAALEHIVALHTHDPRARYHVQWRADQRPLAAALHGAYAHLGVASYWHAAVRLGSEHSNEAARRELSHWRAAVCDAIDQIQGSGELTEAGKRFIADMTTATGELQDDPILPAAAAGTGRGNTLG